MATLDVAEVRLLSDAQYVAAEGPVLEVAHIRILADDVDSTGAVLELNEVRVLGYARTTPIETIIDIAEIRMLGAIRSAPVLQVGEVRLLGGDVQTPVPLPVGTEPALLRLEDGYWRRTKEFRLGEDGVWYDLGAHPQSPEEEYPAGSYRDDYTDSY